MTAFRLAGSTHIEQVARVAKRVFEGGGVQQRFQELCVSGAPYTSFPSEGEGPQTVRQVTALLGHLDTIHIGSLKPSACGCIFPAAQTARAFSIPTPPPAYPIAGPNKR